jgi:hypothetical protein
MPYATVISVKLFHSPAELQGSISSLEFNLDKAAGWIWHDISKRRCIPERNAYLRGGRYAPHHDRREDRGAPDLYSSLLSEKRADLKGRLQPSRRHQDAGVYQSTLSTLPRRRIFAFDWPTERRETAPDKEARLPGVQHS